MDRANRKKVLLISPSGIVARGLGQVFRELGEFVLESVMPEFSPSCQTLLKNTAPDAVIIDPVAFDRNSRKTLRQRLSELTDAPVLLLHTIPCDGEEVRMFDGVIGLYDESPAVIRTLRQAVASGKEMRRTDSSDLSAREKEILVSVAQGMLNKEIAYRYGISIHTVITHRKNITRKTGIRTVAGLTVYALINNLVDAGSLEWLQNAGQ